MRSDSPGPENTTTTVTDWMGRTLTYERKHPSHMGFLTRYIDPEGVATDYTVDTHDTPDSPRFMGVESITYANGLWLANYPVSDLSPQTTVVGRQVFGNGLVIEYHYDQAARRTSVQEGDRVTLHEWDAEGNEGPSRKPLGRLAGSFPPPLCRKKSYLPQANRNFLLLAGTKNPSTMLGRGSRPGPLSSGRTRWATCGPPSTTTRSS